MKTKLQYRMKNLFKIMLAAVAVFVAQFTSNAQPAVGYETPFFQPFKTNTTAAGMRAYLGLSAATNDYILKNNGTFTGSLSGSDITINGNQILSGTGGIDIENDNGNGVHIGASSAGTTIDFSLTAPSFIGQHTSGSVTTNVTFSEPVKTNNAVTLNYLNTHGTSTNISAANITNLTLTSLSPSGSLNLNASGTNQWQINWDAGELIIHSPVGDLFNLSPDGSLNLAGGNFAIGADGSLTLPNASIGADGTYTFTANGSRLFSDGNGFNLWDSVDEGLYINSSDGPNQILSDYPITSLNGFFGPFTGNGSGITNLYAGVTNVTTSYTSTIADRYIAESGSAAVVTLPPTNSWIANGHSTLEITVANTGAGTITNVTADHAIIGITGTATNLALTTGTSKTYWMLVSNGFPSRVMIK